MTRPASVNPNIAVMCASVPLICAFDEHHSWLSRFGSPGPILALGHIHCSVPQVVLCPLFCSNSSEYTHLNLRRGYWSLCLKRFLRARARGSPFTCQNSATRMRVGSSLRAAPMDEKNRALVRVAIIMSSALSFRESMASII